MSKIASTVPPRRGSCLPTSVKQSTLPRRVQSCRIRRVLGGRPMSSSICLRMSAYACSTRTPSLTPGMKNAVTLKPAVAGVLGEGGAHRRGLDLRLKLGDLPTLALGLAVYGILESLEK